MVVRKRLNIKGKALVFVTMTVHKWKAIFSNKTIAEIILNQLKESLVFFKVSLVGYVLMPSHLHALLGFEKAELLSKFVQSFKILSAKKVKGIERFNTDDDSHSRGQFSLWKPRFDDLVIMSENQFKVKLDYIHNNPVKAGLVKKPTDWVNSSALDWLTDKTGPLQIDKEFRWI